MVEREQLTMGQIVEAGVKPFVYTDLSGSEWVLEVRDGVRLDGEL